MAGMIVCLSTAVIGVDFGWQPVAGGGVEYIIQIEPNMLERLKDGQDIFSDLPPRARNIRGYRITVGTARLPHHGQPPPLDADGQDTAPSVPRSDAGLPAHVAPGEASTGDGPLPGPVLAPALAFDPPTTGRKRPSSEPTPLAQPHSAKRLETRPTGFDQEATKPVAHQGGAPPGKIKAKGNPGTKANSDSKTKLAASQPGHDAPDEKATQPTRPSITVIGLFASLGGNAFLLWVAAGQRSRYRALARLTRAPS